MNDPTGRQSLALGPPPTSLTGFPRWTLTPDRTLYRAHRAGRGPWWFAASLTGRFDCPPPEGTCYLAGSAVAALRERLGRRLVAHRAVTAAELDGVLVSALRVLRRRRLADLCSRRAARFGVTREIHVVTPYSITQAWAAAFRAADLAGVRYDARFSTGDDRSYALWGPEGATSWPTDPSPLPGRDVAHSTHITVLPVPATVAVRTPPD